jgi:hypothetical protein
MICACQKAEKVMMDNNATAENNSNVNPASVKQQHYKEMDEFVVAFLRARVNWGRLITYLEAKLEGKAQEMETNQHYFRSMPKLGRRSLSSQQPTTSTSSSSASATANDDNDAATLGKRKREPEDDADADAAVVATPNSNCSDVATGPTRPPQPAAPPNASIATTTATEEATSPSTSAVVVPE